MCSMVVGFLGADGVDPVAVLPSGHHIRWAMEVLGHAFALPMEDADVIAGSLRIYERWLGVDDASLVAKGGKGGKDQRPACMQKVEQTFIQDMLGQMTLLFEERSTSGVASGSVDASVAKHVVLETFDALTKRRGAQLSPQTWDRMIRLLLGAADGVLHNLRNVLGNQLCGQLVRLLFEVYLRSLPHCGPRGELWSLLQKFSRRWIHRSLVIEQWNAVTLALTKSLMRQIHVPDAAIGIEIVWADSRQPSKFEYVISLMSPRDYWFSWTELVIDWILTVSATLFLV
ncbi:hypothetical protein BBJ28_00024676 [Nothophytophthora sp. Chile5]|nr:hypothetical protein BBJ28_00024676 [Nothophytophthora sp. Chile5]